MENNFFEQVNNFITDQIKNLGSTYTQNYSNELTGVFSSAIVVYVIWMGIQSIAGKRQAPVMDLIYDCAKFSILLLFIQNAGGLLDMVSNAAQGLKEGFSGGDSIWSSLDELIVQGSKLSETLKSYDTSMLGLSGVVGSAFVWIGVGFLTMVSSITLIIADITMQFMLLTAPIFIFCLMWGWLRQMFNNWLQILFSSILTVLFVSLVLNMCVSLISQTIGSIGSGNSEEGMWLLGFYILASGVLGSSLIYAAKEMASSIASVGVEGSAQAAAMLMGRHMSSAGGMAGRYSGVSAGSKAGGKLIVEAAGNRFGRTKIGQTAKSVVSRIRGNSDVPK